MPWASVSGNVFLPLKLAGMRKTEARDQVMDALAMAGLADVADAYPRQLSGGMKMRVSIARALAYRRQPGRKFYLALRIALVYLEDHRTCFFSCGRLRRQPGLTVLAKPHRRNSVISLCCGAAGNPACGDSAPGHYPGTH